MVLHVTFKSPDAAECPASCSYMAEQGRYDWGVLRQIISGHVADRRMHGRAKDNGAPSSVQRLLPSMAWQRQVESESEAT